MVRRVSGVSERVARCIKSTSAYLDTTAWFHDFQFGSNFCDIPIRHTVKIDHRSLANELGYIVRDVRFGCFDRRRDCTANLVFTSVYSDGRLPIIDQHLLQN